MAKPNPFAEALERFIEQLKESEDPRSPFYQEILVAVSNLRYHNGTYEQSATCARALQSYIESLDVEQTRRGKTRWLGRKLQPLVDGLMQFTHALDTMIQAGPAPAMLIYGSAKLVLRLAQGFAEGFEMMVGAMREIGTMLECYNIFSRTYDSADAMRDVLVESYMNILIFWQKAAKLFTRNGVKTFFRGIVKPFDSEWSTLKNSLKLNARQVSIFAQALEGSAAKRREDEAKQREQGEDDIARKARRERMRQWLSGFDETAQIDVRMDLESRQKARHIGTCEWIFDDPEYQEWLTSYENETLWLRANPGTGKSVLCSTIIQRLRDENKKVVFFFCSFQEPLKRSITCALKSLALQLFGLHEHIPSEVERLYEYEILHGQTKLQNPTVIVVVLQALLKSLDRVHIILDGLDECENRELIFNMLFECLRTPSLGIIKWLWSSRIEPDFQHLSAATNARVIHMQKAQVENDIKIVIEDSPDMAGSSHHSVEEWTAASDGNFLWLTLMLRTLTGCDLTCPAEVEEELGRFPKGLKQCYQRVLEHLMKRPKSQQLLARRLFLLVAFAKQPLTLCEVLDALSVDEDTGRLSSDRRPFESIVKQLCCPLILLDPSRKNGRQNLILRYFHKSSRDFFLQDPASLDISSESQIFFSSPTQGHLSMSKICMAYLLDERYRTPKAVDPASDSFVDDHCFMRYASLFWHRHFADAGHSDHLFNMVDSFLRSPNFWSCIRVQAVVAPYLFGRLVGDDKRHESVGDGRMFFTMIDPKLVDSTVEDYFVSPLPDWLVDSENGSLLLQTYLALVREWNPILLQQPQAALHCHPGVLGTRNIFSTEAIESPNDSILEMQLCDDFIQQAECQYSRPLPQVVASQPTNAGLRLFSFDSREDGSSVDACLKRWHVNLNASCGTGDLSLKQKGAWDVKSSIKQPLLQLRSDEKIHEPAIWSFDNETLTLSVHRAGSDHVFSPPSEIQQSWSSLCQSLSSCNKSVHEILQRQRHDGHRTILAITWKIGVQSASSDTDGDDSEDSDSDDNSDVTESDRSTSTSNPEDGRNCKGGFCFGLVIVISGLRDPVWFSWESASETPLDFIPACDRNGAVVMWPNGKSSMIYADTLLRKSWEIPMPDLDIPRSVEMVLRDLHFSTCGTILHCLTLTKHRDTASHHTVYNIRLHHLALTTTNSDSVKLAGTSLKPTLPTTTYTTHTVPGSATILRSWGADWVYVAINSPSSFCTVKLLRLPLSITPSPELASVQTSSLPFYVPASFPTRSPKFEVVQTSLLEHIAFVLQPPKAEHTLRKSLGPAMDSNVNRSYAAAAEPTSSAASLPPILITHPISRLGGWQVWDPHRDGREPALDSSSSLTDYLKGDYASADQRFSVPIRSGLNWRKAMTVSCW